MREVRMTFGEHLDELRTRLIFSILYVAVGVGVSLAYGTQLLDWALQPHYRAFGAAQRNRILLRMETTLGRLEEELTEVKPTRADGEREPLLKGTAHWELLFVRDIALPRLYESLERPVVEAADELAAALPSLPASERGRAADTVRRLGKRMSRVLVSEFASELEKPAFSRIPERFERIRDRLRLVAGNEAYGPTKIQRMLGWGEDIGSVVQPMERLVKFIEARRKDALEGRVSLDQLRRGAQDSLWLNSLNDALDNLEKNTKALEEGIHPRIWVISYIESFSAYFKVAIIMGILFALPGILYEMWKFIGAGLYENEQKYVVTILPFSLGMFLAGAAFGYFVMIPVGLEFLAGWGVENVEMSFTLGNYIGLFFTLTLILGLVFQTPLLMIFFAKVGILSEDLYRRGRRIAILVGVILAVVLTPPDPFSWSLMAGPMLVLYEVGILLCRFFVQKKPAETGT